MITDIMRVTEILVLDKSDVRFTKDGFLAAQPRVGRIGIQLYRGDELGRPDLDTVRVWRPESEVMDKAAMASIAHRPITNDHPREAVDASNWKKYAVGQTGDEVVRDGDHVRVPMLLMDATAIQAYQEGKKQLSLGYVSNLEWRAGTNPQGEQYDAVQTAIRVNHLAQVDIARGGPKLAIGDSKDDAGADAGAVTAAIRLIKDGSIVDNFPLIDSVVGERIFLLQGTDNKYAIACDGNVYRQAIESIMADAEKAGQAALITTCTDLLTLIDLKLKEKPKMARHLIDGISIELDDIAMSVVTRRINALAQESTDLATKLKEEQAKYKKTNDEASVTIAKLTTDASVKDAQIVTLTSQLKDAELTPAKLDVLVKDRSLVAGKARIVLGDKLVIDGKTVQEIRRQVVDAKLGAASKDWSDEAVSASFATLTASVNNDQALQSSDQMARHFSGPAPKNNGRSGGNGSGTDVYDSYDRTLSEAWKGDSGKKKKHA